MLIACLQIYLLIPGQYSCYGFFRLDTTLSKEGGKILVTQNFFKQVKNIFGLVYENILILSYFCQQEIYPALLG